MDASLSTLDIAKLRDEDEFDESDDELEEEERQRELKGILSKAFDDVSSIDDEDDENSTEIRSNEYRQPAVATHSLLQNKKKFTSTPNENNNFHRPAARLQTDFSVIEEEPNSIDPTDMASVEHGREPDKNESYHIRLLLDQNQKLNSEKTKLQQLYETMNGDYEGVSYKCQRLEEVLTEKEKLVDDLMGQLTAQQVNLQSAKDALSVTNKKLVIAESTIASLRNELKEMHQSDGMERIQTLYESKLTQLKEKYETERSEWMDEREALKEKIDDQKHQMSKLKTELELRQKMSSERRTSAGVSESTAKRLEQELEKTRNNNRDLSNKLSELHKSAKEMQEQMNELRNSLKSKEQESDSLVAQIQLKNEQLEAQENEIAKLRDEISTLKTSLKEKESLRIADIRSADDAARKDLEKRMAADVEEYRNELQERYQKEFTSRLEEIREAYEKHQQQLEECVEKICLWIEGVADQGVKPQEDELYTVFDPVIKIWCTIEEKMDQQLQKLREAKKEVEEAKKELEEAYIDSKSSSPQNTDHPVLDTLHRELEEAKQEVGALKDKVEKYKKSYTLQLKKFNSEREQLKQDYAALVRHQVSEVCKDREEQLMSLLSRDSRQLLQQINQAYSDSLRNLKEQHDRFFEQTNGRSLRKMGDAIIAYHELVTKKITQRSQHLVQQINQTFGEVDGGDASIIRTNGLISPQH